MIEHKLIQWIKRLARRHRMPLWTPAVIRAAVRTSVKRLRRFYHWRLRRRALSGRTANLRNVESFLTVHAVRVSAPLVLVSQAQRSGGTLLSQLFDSHPDLAAYPHELKVGFPVPDSWPELIPDAGPYSNFRKLFDVNFPRMVQAGFRKSSNSAIRHPFFLISKLSYAVFAELWKTAPPKNGRDILDHYFTGFFNSWLNYKGQLENKKWITAFAPRLAHREQNMIVFFEHYPDGRLIQILRDPKTWYPSAQRHRAPAGNKRSPEDVLAFWKESVRSMLRNRAAFGDRTIILLFEDLVGRTEATMRAVCGALEISYDSTLIEPTFNGILMRANSSFDVPEAGLIGDPLSRADTLDADMARLIDEQCGALYREAVGHALQVTENTIVSEVVS